MPEIITPDGPLEPEASAPDDFGSDIIAQFERRTTTTAAPADEMGMGQSAFPGGTAVDASAQFEAMAAEINAGLVAGDDEPDEEPEGEPTDEPAPEETPVEPAPEETPVAELGGYVWSYLDPQSGAPAAQRYSDVQVQQALQVAAWANNLNDDLRVALGAVEAGQAVAINRSDYDQFQAWLNQRDRGQRDNDLEQLDVDPQVAKVISDFRDEVSSLRTQTQGVAEPQQGSGYDPNVTNQLMGAVNTYRQARQLSQEEVDMLVHTAVNTGIIGHFQQQRQQVNPVTGQVLQAADPTTVMYEALDYSLFRNPALHAAVVSRISQPVLTGQPDQAAASNASVTDITAKRARAASLLLHPRQ